MAKKKINDIYATYFQKSRVFLFPALGIKKATGIRPIETYMSWGDEIKLTDNKLICFYDLRSDSDFIVHEERFLLGNPLFEDYVEVDSNKAVYIFNFESYAEDFRHVVNGKYSQISIELKVKIREVYGINSPEYRYIKSYLHPKAYYQNYAEILSPQEKYIEQMKGILEETVELCSKPDFGREQLKISVKSLKL
jgi:hypothetical protein